MTPIQLSAHTRPITRVRINRDGDLCFSTSKDGKAMVWYCSNGERLGTYDGHNGAIFDFDVDSDTRYGLSAGADCAFGLWEVSTGKLHRLVYPRPPDRVTVVRWGCGSKRFMVCTFGQRKSHILIYDFDAKDWEDESIPSDSFKPTVSFPRQSENWTGHTAKVAEALWGPVGKCVITAAEDGTIRKWDLTSGDGDQFVQYNPQQKGMIITSMSYSKDRTLIIASAKDKTARIFDTQTLTALKCFTSDKPLNCAVIHPFLNLVMVCGGQDARDVTTTGSNSGKFEVEFFHTVFEEKIGHIRTGHFSPINYIALSTDGSHFATGAEEGNVRIFKFDNDFKHKFEALEKSFVDVGMK